MDLIIFFFLILNCSWYCKGYDEDNFMDTRRDSVITEYDDFENSRRSSFNFDPSNIDAIVGIPTSPNHLPQAERLLPGHTLVKPTFGMLKSAVKFPHKEYEGGAGVYGNYNNLGITFGGRNERLLYSGFRRMPGNYISADTGYGNSDNYNYIEASDELNSELPTLTRDNVISELISRYIYRFQDINIYKRNDNNLIIRKFSRDKTKTFSSVGNADDENVESIDNVTMTPKMKKQDWLNKSKHMYDNIKINQEAPEMRQLIPVAGIKESRPYWYFNEDDYKPFVEPFLA